ncbi:MAG: hypothetical protein JWP75_3304, partial [Frondihabitans sp.]|nr:hypothetical protein [Frondihabitans sp.]
MIEETPLSRATRIATVGLVGAAALALTVVSSTAASADPASGAFRQVVAVGSNTTQDLDNGLANGFKLGTATFTPTGALADFASYNALAPTTDAFGTTITTYSGGNAFGRPNGSGDGRKALSASWNSTNHTFNQAVNGVTTPYTLNNSDVSIARSSGKPGTLVAAGSDTDNLTSIPEARDAIGIAMYGVNTSVTGLNTSQLEALYGAGAPGSNAARGLYRKSSAHLTIGDISTHSSTAEKIIISISKKNVATWQAITAVLPQASSGTRSTFLADLGTTNTVFGTWVQSKATQEENDVTALKVTGSIEPFSGASLISQERGLIKDTGVNKSGVRFPTVNGHHLWNATKGAGAGLYATASLSLQGNANLPVTTGVGVFARDVYTVVP